MRKTDSATDQKVQFALNRAVAALDEALKEQEQAAIRIIGLAERIFTNSREEPTRLQAEAIMEACAFQDITGQKIQKVGRLIQFLRDQGIVEAKDMKIAAPPEKKGLNQAEIDRLLRGGKPVVK